MSHPAIQQAMQGCTRLAAAAAKIGAPDPVDAIRQIDYQPESIYAYAEQIDKAVKALDKAIEEHSAAQSQHAESSSGDSSDAAQQQADKELAELQAEKQRLLLLSDKVREIGESMDKLAQESGGQILEIAQSTDPAVSVVLDGGFWDDVTGESAAAEEAVHRAVSSIIAICKAFQTSVEAMRADLNASMDSVEGASGASSGAPNGPGNRGPDGGGGATGGGAGGTTDG
ncbi:hypothetical protein SAMN05192558_110168 [Actinokineospora alba]|uniref:Uncharacterized protein n=1 Tax=Actinokineospora alba TaxID=504798 RepID=A0A1H0TT58_9PSEU|nr:hypothetical protein [Actinokineospora alba]TDP70689.1 hypothetical protein C8E96_6317 [Actinokineospora alba]SDJ13829.1 hypothetical protein SAMN05421871_110168 [Actinokineospora alba]SDP56930.1 hypothetical protein SAMN05192558_110168 [Actinokineospora alba]